MKHLKRTLSMTLAAALLTGTLSVHAGAEESAAFTDADQINYREAVDTMTQLGIIAGKDSGAFDPQGLVTRAEAAKLLAVMLVGGQEDKLVLSEEAPAFTDSQDHWARDYIAFCVQKGVIAGRSEETFDPDGQVTGSELAKMALVALGYDPIVFGLTGADWEISVNAYVNQPNVNLYAGLKDEIDPFEAITREQAAQLLSNTLNAQMMSDSPTQTGVENGEEVTTFHTPKKDEAGDPVTFRMEYFAQPAEEQTPEA